VEFNDLRPQLLKYMLLLVVVLVAWLVVLAVLVARPAASLAEAAGAYSLQNEAIPYQWTSNRVDIPIHARAGPTTVRLSFGPARWPGRAVPTITLTVGGRPLANFDAPDQIRHYHVVLGQDVSNLVIEAPIEQPAGERRWLGVTLYGLTATASGLPLRAATQAIVPALVLGLLALGFAWSARRGHAIIAGLALLALLPRVVLPLGTPPGFRPDEVVSLVDAWNIARTGHDHLGNLLPLGAQEAFGDWISPLLTYLELPAVALFGPHPLVGRLVTAVFGMLAAPLIFVLARALRLPTLAAVCAGLVAALSPWQIFMSRIALPGALVPACWTLCLLAGLLLIRRGGRRDALALALAAGVALYAYPTLKLAAPLLVGAAVVLALLRQGWGAARRWLPGLLLLALLWLPFAYVTLFNAASSTRLGQAAIRADSWSAWLATWWNGYSTYFRPAFYLISGDGDSIRGVAGHGVELPTSAGLVVLGLLALAWRLIADCRLQIADWRAQSQSTLYTLHSTIEWWFIAGMLLIAPLPASLTQPSPHSYRAALIAPLYSLLAGVGAAALLQLLTRIAQARARWVAQAVAATLLIVALGWQAGAWFRDYARDYPQQQAWENQDGLLEAMTRAIRYAPDFDEVWLSYQNINEPYIYLLAAQPMPPSQAQRQIQLTREPGHFNAVTSIGKYIFVRVDAIPKQLPMLEAITDRYGGAAFLLQQWQHDGKRILIVRRMD
jgi:4-amino-4-deoxy-L-arabinose transferase-like glycosyltransferase